LLKAKIMRTIIFYAVFFLYQQSAFSQTTEDSVKTVVNRLFIAMQNSDSILLRSAFADSGILQTIVVMKDGKVTIKNEQVSEFAAFLNTIPKGNLDERIEFDVIRIDGNLAIAWTPYKFYFKGKFIHCGVNSFQLVRINKEWKIQYLIDTRRTNNCG
jgi:hypothetical protein